jgi:hypothetical protein
MDGGNLPAQAKPVVRCRSVLYTVKLKTRPICNPESFSFIIRFTGLKRSDHVRMRLQCDH